MILDTADLFQRIIEKRNCGKVHIYVFEKPAALSWEEVLIEKAKEFSFFNWESIVFYRKKKKSLEEQPVFADEVNTLFLPIKDREAALHILARLIHKDMAYGYAKFPLEEIIPLAEEFISLFEKDADYYSNSNWKNHHLNAWNGLTNATFDSGIIAVDKCKVGIAWFEDED